MNSVQEPTVYKNKMYLPMNKTITRPKKNKESANTNPNLGVGTTSSDLQITEWQPKLPRNWEND